jgi:Rrf2 family protein
MLGEQPAGRPLLIAEIAEAKNLPKKFLELILLELKHHGILHSKRGKHGVYVLARDPSDITFGEVVRIIDGPVASVRCASQSA